ncbi:hypothetical protein QFC22_001496 [Naganishia vaughanmartiniae]|uniref:Uncharacterized protein n=1 Tax=Naganishia vaughanmartiniae TaxID=1424756 RepID=A0ACC2XHJ5_9TREE|nr:hypothetical protein QFC22_001496 [Naganishia vaughanmartiniae]
MGSDSDDIDKSPEITFVKESFSARSSKVAVHPSSGKVSRKSQVKVKREMKRESDPEPTEHEYDERQDFCSRLSILIKANGAAFAYFKESLARFSSNETDPVDAFGQLGAGPSDSGLNYSAGSFEDQYLFSNSARLPAPPVSALDPALASLNDYSHLMSDRYLMNEAIVGVQPATDSGSQHQEYQCRHHSQPQTVQTTDVLVDNSKQGGVRMENPSWDGSSAAGFSASPVAAPGIERDSGGEGSPSDGESKPVASEMVRERVMPSAVLAFSDTIAGSIKRQRTAPEYAPVSTAEKPARQTKSRVSATASAGSGTPAQGRAVRLAARPRGKGKKVD